MSPLARRMRRWPLLCLLALPVLPAAAQDQKESRTAGFDAIIDNVDLLIDNYSKFLGRKYNLTEEQDDYTKALLREKAYEFIDKHEDELRHIVDRMFDVRTGGEMTQEELIEWGKQAQPLYEDAKKLIIAGNDEWREILTPEQRKIHDEDLKLMEESFRTTEDQLQRIISGQMTVDEFRSPRRSARRRANRNRTKRQSRSTPQTSGASIPPADPGDARGARKPPSRPPLPPPPPQTDRRRGGSGAAAAPRSTRPRHTENPARSARLSGSRVRASKGGKGYEGKWDKYVADFIKKYQLNDEQQQKAHGILADCKKQAQRYLKSREGHFARIDKQIEALKKSRDKNKAKKQSALNNQRKKLMEPLDKIFDSQLKPRLERIPTRAQRKAATVKKLKTGTAGSKSRHDKKK